MEAPAGPKRPNRVRPAGPADIPEMLRVINAAFRVEDFFVTGDRTSADDLTDRMARPGAALLVAERPDGRGLAGAVYVELRKRVGFFGMLAVDPAEQGQGHGRVLIEAVEEYCREAGCSAVEIEVVNLREELPAFYLKMGYAATGEAPFTKLDQLTRPAHMILMRKPIGLSR